MIELFTMINLLDFGFNPTSICAITYVFPGAKELKKTEERAIWLSGDRILWLEALQ